MSRFVAIMLVAMLAGCAGGPTPPSDPPTVQPSWTSCAVDAPDQSGLERPSGAAQLPPLDDSFRPVAAVLCLSAPLRRSDGGTDLAATEKRADDVTALVAALRLPDERLSGGACTLEAYHLPFFALLDAQGRWVRPGAPSDQCGKVRIEVRTALENLRLTPVSSRPVEELQSSEAAAAGCSRQWADMVWVTGGWGASDQAAVVPPGFDGPVEVRLCAYRVPAAQQRTGKPAGDFVAGRHLSEEQWAAARREIEAAAPAGPCTIPAGSFVVLHHPAGQLYVELDGCRRLLAQTAGGEQTLRQATPALLKLLAPR